MRLRLNDGSVIVSAAKNRKQNLYVETRDATISVVDTVSLVTAEQTGSRVAVIQGEAQVRQGTTVKTLVSGDQLATGEEMAAIPLARELSWSQEAAQHLALVQRPAAPAASASPLKFEVASIRPHPGIAVSSVESSAFVCHGVDGNRRAANEFIGSSGRLIAPQGRCLGSGTWLTPFIAFAFGVPSRDVFGVPDWANPPERIDGRAQPGNAFHIEAAAPDPSTATASQLIEMVQTMLADRFKLKVRREMRDVPGFALVVSKKGAKLRLKNPSDTDELPDRIMDESFGRPVLRGKSTMEQLAQWLSGASGGVGTVGAPVVDRTGLRKIYDYTLDTADRGGAGGARGGGPVAGQVPRLPTPDEIASRLSPKLEDQLGLQLVPEKAIRVEVIVVEHLERPSEN